MRPEAIDWFNITFSYLLNHFVQAFDIAAPIAASCFVASVIISLMIDGKFRVKEVWDDWTKPIYRLTAIWYGYFLLKPIFINQLLLKLLLVVAIAVSAFAIFILLREWVQKIILDRPAPSRSRR